MSKGPLAKKRTYSDSSFYPDWAPIKNLEFYNKDILIYMLSFAYENTFNLALVSKSFFWITRSHMYWKYIAHHYLKNIVPSIILKEVDFFYDPPWYFLGSILCPTNPPEITPSPGKGVAFPSVGITYDSWALNWTRSSNGYSPLNSFAITLVKDDDIHDSPVLVTYFNEPRYRKLALVPTTEGTLRILYSEFWSEDHTRIWCGLGKNIVILPDTDLPTNPEPHEPFGRWITF